MFFFFLTAYKRHDNLDSCITVMIKKAIVARIFNRKPKAQVKFITTVVLLPIWTYSL